MPRPREFDEEQVVASAMDLFWSRGYEATSVSDLMAATGLAKGSIYKGFGDKRAFFLRTLETYLDQNIERVRGLLQASSAEQGLRTWLGMVIDLATCSGERRGCYAVNCAIELAPHDPEVRERVRTHYRRMWRQIGAVVQQGIDAGEFDPGLDPPAVARSLTNLVSGLQVSGKLGMTRPEALAMVDLALRGLQPTPGAP